MIYFQSKTTNVVDHDIVMKEDVEEEGELCLLCANTMKCGAIAKCNHPICHICAIRLRVKSKDKHCPICKDESDVVIVYSVNHPNFFFHNLRELQSRRQCFRKPSPRSRYTSSGSNAFC